MNKDYRKLEDVHSCQKSEGKLVAISVNKWGLTFCGYCNKQIDYRKFMELRLKDFEKMVIE